MPGEHHHHINLDKEELDLSHSSTVDTKSKLLLTMLYIIVTTIIIRYEQLILISIFTLILMFVYRVNIWSVTLKALLPLPLVISLSILSLVSDLGDNILRFGEVVMQYSDWELAIFFFLRSVVIVYGAISLVESEESFFEVIYAIDELGLPDALVSLLMITYRTSLDLFVEAKRMIDVRYSRSTYKRWGTNLYTFKIIGYMLGSVLVRSFLKKDIRRDALYSRNFSGDLHHKPKPFRFNGILLLWIGTITLIIILLSANMSFIDVGTQL